jgi:hypothetical protein
VEDCEIPSAFERLVASADVLELPLFTDTGAS